MTKPILLLALCAFLAASCGSASPPAETTIPISPTTIPTGTPIPTVTPTPAPLLATSTPTPLEGAITVQVNVRSGPGTGYSSLGLLSASQEVRIFGKDESGEWYFIFYEAGPQKRGWVTASYVQAADADSLPVVLASGTQASASTITGTITQQLNVRTGPGSGYDLLGRLDPGMEVVLTGKNQNATWLQIEYTSGPDGRGWVAAGYLQVKGSADLPVLNALGTPQPLETAIGTSAPAMTPTPTIGPAVMDNDSPSNPAVRVVFSPAGTGQFNYTGDVSTPEGDGQDWIEFTPYAAPGRSKASLTASLVCIGNGMLEIELLQNNVPLQDWGSLECGDLERSITLPAGVTYHFHVQAGAGSGLQFTHYTLILRNKP